MGIAISGAGTSSTSGADGTYAVTMTAKDERLVLGVSDPTGAFAPTTVVVNRKDAVTRYSRNIVVEPTQSVTFDVGEGKTLPVQSQGRTATITVPPGAFQAAGSVQLTVAGFTASDGPGALEPSSAPDTERLQSLGMVYLGAQDEHGSPVTLAPGAAIDVAFAAHDLMNIPDVQSLHDYSLDTNDRWADLEPTNTSATGSDLVAEKLGYWNADRAYRTACVKGHVHAPSQSCAGAQVSINSLDGISSSDSIGDDGAFCVNGPQTVSAPATVGSMQTVLTFPANAGNCGAPDGCKDLGTLEVGDSDCNQDAPATPTACKDGTYKIQLGDDTCGGFTEKGSSSQFTVVNGKLMDGDQSVALDSECGIKVPLDDDNCPGLASHLVFAPGGECEEAVFDSRGLLDGGTVKCCQLVPCAITRQ